MYEVWIENKGIEVIEKIDGWIPVRVICESGFEK